MTDTEGLIDALVAGAAPVRPAPPPWRRAALWLAGAVALLAALAPLHGLRPDLADRLGQETFCAGLAGALLTGGLAALAACLLSLPDRSRGWLLLPLPGVALWAGGVGLGCATDWVALHPAQLAGDEALRCFGTLLLCSAPLAAGMAALLRHAARLRPTPAILAGALAVAAFSASAMALLHRFDASAMVLAWNFGAAMLVIALDAAFARLALRRWARQSAASARTS